MYRARVEAIDGLKVRAGGKWLTCIGNRVFRAGDMVWTDGRCVYGHDREPQTPIVIANPPKDTPYIPISTNPVADLLSSWGKGQRHLYTDKLNFIDESFDDESGYHGYTYGKCVTAGRHAVYFEWYRRSFSGGTQVIWTPAINVDKEENIYTLSYKMNHVSDPQGRLDRGHYLSIDIKKNGQTISSFSTADKRENMASKVHSLVAQEFYSGRYVTQYRASRTRIIVGRRDNIAGEDTWQYHEDFYNEIAPRLAREMTTIVMERVQNFVYPYPMYDFEEAYPRVETDILWSFIESENNWAIIVEVRGSDAGIETSKPTELSDPISRHYMLYMTGYWINDPITVDIEATTSSTYLITNNGSKLLAEATMLVVSPSVIFESPECAAVREMAGLPPLSYGSLGNGKRRLSKTFNIDGYAGLVLPMQDGFYYKINKPIDISGGGITHPALIDVTIYAPSDKPIFSGIFFSDSYLAACRIKSNKYLISVRTLEKAYPYQDEEWDKYKSLVVRRGLYLCQGETLEKISDKVIENQSLRSSKIFKKWDGTLQRVPK